MALMNRAGRGRAARRLLGVAANGAAVLLAAAGCLLPTNGGTTARSPRPLGAPPGTVDYRATHPEWLTDTARIGQLTYPTSPPVGGDHGLYFMDCAGENYPEPVPNEYAVTSLEHGAVWVTYQPDLAAGQVRLLADRVSNQPYVFSSPYPGLDRPVSLQAWGYQLKVDSADDPAIDQFIAALRIRAAVVPGAPCIGGTTRTERGPDLGGLPTPSGSPSPGPSGSPTPSGSPGTSPSPSVSPKPSVSATGRH
jgi:Protein of unknown function (DUF3105)